MSQHQPEQRPEGQPQTPALNAAMLPLGIGIGITIGAGLGLALSLATGAGTKQ